MKTHRQTIAAAFGFVLIAGLLVLMGIYPYRPSSTLGWVTLFALAVPLVLLFEFGGERLLKPSFVSRFGRFGRIVYGIVVMGVILAMVLVAFQFLEPFLTKWGS